VLLVYFFVMIHIFDLTLGIPIIRLGLSGSQTLDNFPLLLIAMLISQTILTVSRWKLFIRYLFLPIYLIEDNNSQNKINFINFKRNKAG